MIKTKFGTDWGNKPIITLEVTGKHKKYDRYLMNDYECYQRKDGIIFGRCEGIGDVLDHWANHIYYIAVKENGKIVSFAKRISGWYYSDFSAYDSNGKYIPVSNVNEWKKYVSKKYGKM